MVRDPTEVNFDTSTTADLFVAPVYENWADVEVFSPMLPADIRAFLMDYLLPMVADDAHRAALENIFLEFIKRWTVLTSSLRTIQYVSRKAGQRATTRLLVDSEAKAKPLRAARRQLLLDVVSYEKCNAGEDIVLKPLIKEAL